MNIHTDTNTSKHYTEYKNEDKQYGYSTQSHIPKLQKKRETINCKVCRILTDSVDRRPLNLKLTSKYKIREWYLPPSCLKIEPHECETQGSVARNMGICLPCLWWEKGIPVMRKLETKQIQKIHPVRMHLEMKN